MALWLQRQALQALQDTGAKTQKDLGNLGIHGEHADYPRTIDEILTRAARNLKEMHKHLDDKAKPKGLQLRLDRIEANGWTSESALLPCSRCMLIFEPHCQLSCQTHSASYIASCTEVYIEVRIASSIAAHIAYIASYSFSCMSIMSHIRATSPLHDQQLSYSVNRMQAKHLARLLMSLHPLPVAA